ncbi:PhoU family transcriptional regulator [Candidatus Bathyarchaeota archaeon]|nr:PhoU family transcriptional regulator [Candidatus Bathyarchaeota archaeon]
MSEADKKHWKKITLDLVTLKDTSELMMDLAYSALLLNSNYLAEEVMNMEQRMDELHIDFQCEVLSQTDAETNPSELLGIIRMGNVTERIADAASEIAEVVLRGGEPHPILSMVIQDAEETVEHVVVSKDSPVAGKTLKEIEIADETGMWVLFIRRGSHWMRPKPNTVLEPGDLVVASGYSEGEDDFKQLLSGKKK